MNAILLSTLMVAMTMVMMRMAMQGRARAATVGTH
jgi:hypothetical protein